MRFIAKGSFGINNGRLFIIPTTITLISTNILDITANYFLSERESW
jgi:hypothetical protein